MQRYPSFKTSVLSRLFGRFARKKFPSFFQSFINQTYVRCMNVDLRAFKNAASYESLNALFTRKFVTPRSFDTDASVFISPCDGKVSAYGTIQNDTALQIKGFDYRIGALLSDYVSKNNRQKLQNGVFINVYLSPKDYHRYHAPLDMRIAKAVHIPGKLYPVNLSWLKKVDELFIENERVVLECYTKNDHVFYMVFVGALNVGKIVFHFDPSIQTNASSKLQRYYYYTDLHVKKGDEIGLFEMGSTIVMLFEPNALEWDFSAVDNVTFGQTLGRVRRHEPNEHYQTIAAESTADASVP
ncbi:phosphatidylserine decarboxylase [Sulfurospirillum sp. MES]|uniref:phosphatidylserine decarboxylase n=1 Tax=Sulfurospirillum sp. MES TaxID=1565314 RepID=UPI0005436883|nr:phosphatidylserine decarboxylase [Sulfurospirillum sp. MES]KHG32948.1 MAG: phosphatidylserine decarboxylase [Sulfurospirillum sp. MES]